MMPLPFDLASVAWLKISDIGPAHRYAAFERKRAKQRKADLAIVVKDQQRYIVELEAMVRPGLVQPIADQESML